MNHVNLRHVPEEELRSPTGKFHSFCRNISLALGGVRNVGVAGGGHPFDVQLRRLPPGAAVCPHHAHYSQWELFVVRAGRGTVRADERRYEVRTGDVFIHPPGEAHQLINTGLRDLEVMIVADHPALDACYYPDSDKWGLRPPGKAFRMHACDYYDGEDDLSSAAPGGYRPPPLALPRPVSSFRRRRTQVDDMPWSRWRTPKGKFEQLGRGLSEAIGDVRGGWPQKGHPFNLELVKVPAGRSAGPLHAHLGQWEMFMILEGAGTVRLERGRRTVGPGDVVMHPPGEAHQLTNTGRRPLLFYIIADNPPLDIFRYPESDKWGFLAPRKYFRMTEVPYPDGEE
ncbi:MAG TPA: cupin domain-containing protein [Opitutaceae bacterium]|nr:cupin domain-containing protein [Opitutaceae bacterium]